MIDFSNSLLVPVSLKALVVNDKVIGEKFRRWDMEFRRLKEQFINPEAPAFEGEDKSLSIKRGVYLHWEMPEALRKGSQKEDGETEFPLLPNRWLVVRKSGKADKRQTKTWMIKSDYLDARNYQKGSQYIDPFKKELSPTKIGTVSEFKDDDWQNENDGNEDLFLTAMGYGYLTFLAYQPLINNVFSFYDNLENVNPTHPISYMVIGWYSNPKKDILKINRPPDSSPQAVLTDLNWHVNLPKEATLARSVYHGMLTGIDFRTAKHAVEAIKGINVAVGNTSIDAFTALLKRRAAVTKNLDFDETDADLLKAFQYGLLPLLEQPDGEALLDQEIRKNWFSSRPGGIAWEFTDEDEMPGKDEVVRQRSDEELQEEDQFLADLNQRQNELEHLQNELLGCQQALYAGWWKEKAEYVAFSEEQDLKDRITELRKQIVEVSGNLPLAEFSPVNGDTNAVQEKIAQFAGKKRILKAVAKPFYWMANDPVVLITGVKNAPNLNIGKSLQCRMPDQLISGFRYQAREIKIENFPSAVNPGSPALITDLLNEFFFLDPGNSEVIAQKLTTASDENKIDEIRKIMSDRSGEHRFTGILPENFSVKQWQQPWAPLFMEWEIEYYPIPFKTGEQKNWEFNGKEYVCPKPLKPRNDLIIKIKGRAMLTPANNYLFKERIKEFIATQTESDDLKDNGNLNDFMHLIDRWDFISQSLTGFNEQCTLRTSQTRIPPDAAIPEFVDDAFEFTPDFKNKNVSDFQEMRQGQFSFTQMMIYDAFGQAIDVIDEKGKFGGLDSAQYFRPISDRNFKPQKPVDSTNEFRFVQLPPRLLQYSRLDFCFVDAADDEKEINLTHGANPVCGWIIPNHIDEGLAFYDAEGVYQGELIVALSKQIVQWCAHQPEDSNPMPANSHLRNMIQGLLDSGADAFHNFIKTIDESLWTIDVLGERNRQNLSILTGKPLAIVRSKLQFALDRPVIINPHPDCASYEPEMIHYDFEIMPGNLGLREDGLIGYYSENDYSKFNTLHFEEKSDYIQKIGKGNFVQLQFKDKSQAYLTMIIEPGAKIHAESGILPTVSITLPEKFVTGPLQNMEIIIRQGPLLTVAKDLKINEENSETEKIIKSIVLPTPAESAGNWVWLQKEAGEWQEYAVCSALQIEEYLQKKSVIREGFLKLSREKD